MEFELAAVLTAGIEGKPDILPGRGYRWRASQGTQKTCFAAAKPSIS